MTTMISGLAFELPRLQLNSVSFLVYSSFLCIISSSSGICIFLEGLLFAYRIWEKAGATGMISIGNQFLKIEPHRKKGGILFHETLAACYFIEEYNDDFFLNRTEGHVSQNAVVCNVSWQRRPPLHDLQPPWWSTHSPNTKDRR